MHNVNTKNCIALCAQRRQCGVSVVYVHLRIICMAPMLSTHCVLLQVQVVVRLQDFTRYILDAMLAQRIAALVQHIGCSLCAQYIAVLCMQFVCIIECNLSVHNVLLQYYGYGHTAALSVHDKSRQSVCTLYTKQRHQHYVIHT
jgi:hypothetical protein